jgi:hypothetical protein
LGAQPLVDLKSVAGLDGPPSKKSIPPIASTMPDK